MFNSIYKILRSKSRRQWRQIAKKIIDLSRDTLKSNGEISALVGLVIGILIVLLFKWILFLFVLGSLLMWAVYMIAPEDF